MSDEEQPPSSEEMLREVAEWLGEEGGFGDQVEPIPQDAVIENTGPPKTDDEHAAGWA